MKKFQFTPAGTIIVQLPSGVEATCLQDTDGTMYVPMMQISGGTAVEKEAAAEPAPVAKSKVAPTVKKSAAPVEEDDDADEDDEDDDAPVATAKQYTAKELKAIDDKDALLKILDNRLDPADTEGKNTAEKYRRLILLAQEESDDEEEEEAPAPKKAAKVAAAPVVAKSKKVAPVIEEDEEEEDEPQDALSVTAQIEEVLTSFDAQDITLKKAVARLMKFATKAGANEAKVTKLLSAFEKDSDGDTEETAAAIAAEISDEKPAKPAKPAAKAVAAKGKKVAPVVEEEADDDDSEEDEDEDEDEDEGEVVEISDLVKGDSVAVFWAKMDEWYTGTVASVKKGVVTIDYEDETSEILDATAHTEIRRYA